MAEDKKKLDSKELKKKAEAEAKEAEFRSKYIEDIPRIIAAVSPERYSLNAGEVKKLLKNGKFWEAVDKVKPGIKPGDTDMGYEYKITYNSPYETLEPVYFWILDFMNPDKTEKLVDNFISSPGSGHFSELMGKATRMQEEAMKVMQTIGVLIKSIINIIYDLRQFEQRLQDYKDADSSDKVKAEAANIALKQIWMDNVDIKRGNTSVKAMAFSQASFATLIDAFMYARSLDQIEKELDLNERVKRILKDRFLEYSNWRVLSGSELKKRFNIEKAYLKSQVDSLKLYTRWAKPYLKAAEELKMSTSMSSSSALVKAFNTILMQLVLFKKDAVKVQDEVYDKNFPPSFARLVEHKKIRDYNACNLVDLRFRGIPQRSEQHYTFGGRVDVVFKAYALNDDEIKLIKKKLGESDMRDALKLAEGATEESLGQIQEDIDHYLKGVEDKEDEEEAKERVKSQDINPFMALLGLGNKSKEEKNKEQEKNLIIKSDTYAEKYLRNFAETKAKGSLFTVYDIYKKSHGMASVPFRDQLAFKEKAAPSVEFGDIFKK
ncbi:hypothetical protein FJZ17_03270 [Candidatus Pacearchaeota archaeon]|nr:hypothetical protein [Candidatus Pacearchaeota archaeon]